MNKVQQQSLKQALLDLRTKLTAPVYDLMSEQEKLDSLNTTLASEVTWTNAPAEIYQRVPYSHVVSYLAVQDKWSGILNSTVDEAVEFLDLIGRFEDFNRNKDGVDTAVSRVLDGLIGATPALLTTEEKTFILGLAEISMAQALGMASLKPYEITNAENAS